ncbi:MAG: UDP-N-acetylmuramate dehydrogenase [Nitrospiria bacterium]
MILAKMKSDKKNSDLLRKALEGYPGEVRWKEPIAPYTSLKIGGLAEVMVFPKSISEVGLLMERISRDHLSCFILGGGSNLLVKDGGIKGVVLHLSYLNRIEERGPQALVAEGGVSFPRLATTAMEKGLSGLEFAVGIPGTVGGAVVMNAGIPGEETESVLSTVAFVDAAGGLHHYPKERVHFGYRSTHLPKGVVVSASFHLTPAPIERIDEKLKQLLKRRRETQPLSFPSVGSVFKNPPEGFAGEIIEACGLKGTRIGGAQISERHGNFIINRGSAKAEEVLALIRKIRARVAEARGIELELEVKVVGVDPEN